MRGQEKHSYWVIILTFLLAALLCIIPLPDWLLWARPEWLALVLIYWVIALPHRVGIFTGLALGLFLDILEGALLGQNALSLAILALLSHILYQRMRVTSLWQQSAMVFLLVGINQLICQWIQNLEGIAGQSLIFLLPAFTSALLWPMVLLILRGLRRHFEVS